MKKSKKKNKELNLIKIFTVGIVGIVLVAYVIYTIYTLIKHPTDTFMIENGKVYKEETFDGYIIREETLIKGENYKNGIVKIKNEGERVAKDAPIFRYQSKKEGELTKKIEDLNLEIQEALNKETNIFPSDIVLLERQIKTKLDEIYKLNNIQSITKNKTDINASITKKAKIAGELSPSGSYIKKLIEKRSGYENELNSNSEYKNATTSGMVSYRIDGLEEILNSQNLNYLNKELLENLEIKTGQLIGNSEETAKVVNNFYCYIAVVLESLENKNIKVGDTVKLQFLNLEQVSANIETIVEGNDGTKIVVFKVKNGVEKLLEYRKISLDIIWWSLSGLKVPNSALLEENGRNFVVRNRVGYIDKILVNVLNQNENYSIIDNYTFEELKKLGYTSAEIGNLKKITLYDEILINYKE